MQQEAKIDGKSPRRRTVSLRPAGAIDADAGRSRNTQPARADRASSRPRSSTTSTSSPSSAATACAASRCSRRSRTWDDLTFLPGTLTRFVIEGYREKCETKTVIGPRAKRPMVLDIPVYVTGMSFGALSYEAKIALARGATMAGSATCSGEGGMIPDERRYSIEVVLPVHPVALRLQPAPSAAGRCLRVLHRPGLQGRARRPSDGPEGDRPGGGDALAAGRHRPALAGAPPRLARARRSRAQDPGDPRGDQLARSRSSSSSARRASMTTCAWR